MRDSDSLQTLIFISRGSQGSVETQTNMSYMQGSISADERPLLLALISRRYDLRLVQEKVEPYLMVTLRPKGGIRMTLQPRTVPAVASSV